MKSDRDSVENKKITEEELDRRKANAKLLGTLPADTLNKEIVEKHFSRTDVANLRLSCRFFGLNAALKQELEKKKWHVELCSVGTFFLQNGRLFVIGDDYGLNNSGLKNTLMQISLPDNKTIVDVKTGAKHAVILDEKGNYYKFGSNYFNQLDSTSNKQILQPELLTLPNDEPIAEVVLSNDQTFIRNAAGKWYYSGIIVGRINSASMMPVSLPNNKLISKIATKDTHTLLQDIDGQWYGWGNGKSMGMSDYLHHPVPINLPNNKPILGVALGRYHTFFQDSSGQWHYAGFNTQGQLGIKSGRDSWDEYSKIAPVILPNGRSVIKVIAGDHHSLFCDDQCNWYISGAYGWQRHGQGYSMNYYSDILTAVKLPNQHQIVEIKTNACHTFYRDQMGIWYFSGGHRSGIFMGLSDEIVTFQPKLFDFSNLEQKIQEVEQCKQNSFRP